MEKILFLITLEYTNYNSCFFVLFIYVNVRDDYLSANLWKMYVEPLTKIGTWTNELIWIQVKIGVLHLPH